MIAGGLESLFGLPEILPLWFSLENMKICCVSDIIAAKLLSTFGRAEVLDRVLTMADVGNVLFSAGNGE